MTQKWKPVFWFTGLSGAGKTTLSAVVMKMLLQDGYDIIALDGDDIRSKLHVNLSFSEKDIKTNNALIADLCLEKRQFHDAILVPIISPYRQSRSDACVKLSPGFFEVYLNANLNAVVKRDVKGLYAKAKRGEISNMIGFHGNTPYEEPLAPDIIIPTGLKPLEECSQILYDFIRLHLPEKG